MDAAAKVIASLELIEEGIGIVPTAANQHQLRRLDPIAEQKPPNLQEQRLILAAEEGADAQNELALPNGTDYRGPDVFLSDTTASEGMREPHGPHWNHRIPALRKQPSGFLRHLVAWIGGVGALSPTGVPGYAMRTYSGRPSSARHRK